MKKFIGIFALAIACLISCNTKTAIDGKSLPRSTPSAEGVSSEWIIKYIDAVNQTAQKDKQFHSLMILKNGKVITEAWWKPYAPDCPHTMYSVTKSFTATAIGFAVNEGLLNVTDKLVSFFPDQIPDKMCPYMNDVTIEHLLTMSSGMIEQDFYASGPDQNNIPKSFLATPINIKPGTKFDYNSIASHMLSEILQKVTGETMKNYLKPRLLEPLGIEHVVWDQTNTGVTIGGWGINLKTEDMAKFGQLFLNDGMWNGKRILPEGWVTEATQKRIMQEYTTPEMPNNKDWFQGYGYLMWRSRNNSFRADGAYGQFIIMIPEHDAVIAITAHHNDGAIQTDQIWEYLLPALQNGASGKKSDQELLGKLENLTIIE